MKYLDNVVKQSTEMTNLHKKLMDSHSPTNIDEVVFSSAKENQTTHEKDPQDPVTTAAKENVLPG